MSLALGLLPADLIGSELICFGSSNTFLRPALAQWGLVEGEISRTTSEISMGAIAQVLCSVVGADTSGISSLRSLDELRTKGVGRTMRVR